MASFTPSARMLARRHNVDIASLIDIMSHQRPYPSEGEQAFIAKYLDGIEGMQRDDCGNRYIAVPRADGTPSNIMWSCHTDSVHSPKLDGRQNLKWDADGNILSLNEGKAGQCLGADDGAGMWLLLEMLKAGKPGLYIFHRGEEKGGVGSRWLVQNTPHIVQGIDCAIAFDRRALTSVITHQGGMRTCSDAFAKSFAAGVDMGYKIDTGGSFTDTKVYTDLIAECTNISVGYYDEHGPRETLDVRHVLALRTALLALDTDTLVVEREPGTRETLGWGGSYGGGYSYYGRGNTSSSSSSERRAWEAGLDDDAAYVAWLEENYGKSDTKKDTPSPLSLAEADKALLLKMVKNFPEVVVKILQHFAVDHFDIADIALSLAGSDATADELIDRIKIADVIDNKDRDLAGVDIDNDDESVDMTGEIVTCASCQHKMAIEEVGIDMRCEVCYANIGREFEDAIEAQDRVTLEKIDAGRVSDAG